MLQILDPGLKTAMDVLQGLGLGSMDTLFLQSLPWGTISENVGSAWCPTYLPAPPLGALCLCGWHPHRHRDLRALPLLEGLGH